MAFVPQQMDKYVAALQNLKQTIKNTNNNEVVLSKYKIVFLTILEILNQFYTKLDASAADHNMGEDDADAAPQLKRTLKQMCRLDMSIYEEFTRLDFNELLGALLNISSSISSLNRDMLKEGDSSAIFLAMQSFFAFRKAIVTNEYLVQQHESATSFDTFLEHKLMAEYCFVLTNVYYFQRRFIHVYLDPLLRQYEKNKIADCATKQEEIEQQACVENTNSDKITVIWMHLFIQAARQNYLTDFCNTSHKPKTLEKKCSKILHLFTNKVLNDTNEKRIQRLFERITYTSTIASVTPQSSTQPLAQSSTQPLAQSSTQPLAQSSTQPLADAVQLLMKLYLLLHNKICKVSDEWRLQDDKSTDVESLARDNHINIMVLNRDATTADHVTARYNDEMGYFVLVKELDSYRIAFNSEQVQFEPSDDGAPRQKEQVMLGGAKNMLGGAKKNGTPRSRYAESDRGRIREKASLDAQSKIYKPLLLAYYIEIALELFPAKLENVPEQKQSYLCTKRKQTITNSFQSVKQSIQGVFRKNDAKAVKLPTPMYYIPSLKHDQKYDDEKVQVMVNADQTIHDKINQMHQSLGSISHAVYKVNVVK